MSRLFKPPHSPLMIHIQQSNPLEAPYISRYDSICFKARNDLLHLHPFQLAAMSRRDSEFSLLSAFNKPVPEKVLQSFKLNRTSQLTIAKPKSPDPVEHLCDFCPRAFKGTAELSSHIRQKHPACSVCQLRVENTDALFTHKVSSHHVCEECGRAFLTGRRLQQVIMPFFYLKG